MDTEAEAGDSRSEQSIAASLSDERLQCELHAVNIKDGAGCNDENNDNCNIVSDSCTNCSESPCTASDCDTKTRCLTCHVDCDNSLTSSELNDAELVSSENRTKDAENNCCFICAEDDKVTDYCTLDDKSMRVIDFNNDQCSESQRLPMSECHECDEVTCDAHQQLADLGQSFIVSPETQTHCTSSLQDAFMQFLKKKQVS